MDNGRAQKLTKHLHAIIYGRTTIHADNSTQFIEGICSQQDRADCISKLIAGKAGLDALQSSMRYRLDAEFFNGDASKLLTYLQDPAIKDLARGSLLYQVVTKIIDPPIFWDAFLLHFGRGLLSIEAQQNLAWLLHFLVAYPTAPPTYRQQASDIVGTLVSSSDSTISALGAKIKQITDACGPAAQPTLPNVPVPGGRHDNDFADFRKVSIAPSAEEISSTQQPYLRRHLEVEDTPDETRIATHLDNQFRLLREDMIYEMKEELQIAFKKKKGYHRGTIVTDLELSGIHFGPDNRQTNWGLTFKCKEDIPILRGIKAGKDRNAKLNDHRNTLRHQSMGCLLVDGKIVAFPMINRDEDLLSQKPPTLILQLNDEAATKNAFLKLKLSTEVRLLQIDTAIFSFAPILEQLQNIRELPLLSELLLWSEGSPISSSPHLPCSLLEQLEHHAHQDLKNLLNMPKSITLDTFQLASLVSGLTQSVSLIQGPPGTGKSLIGALIAKSLHKSTQVRILVVCYTNHALDDILTSFLDTGIPEADIVRLGGKSTQRTDSLLLYKQKSSFRMNKGSWAVIDYLKSTQSVYRDNSQRQFSQYYNANVTLKDILQHTEFEEPAFFKAFRVPVQGNDLQRVGKKGKVLDELYLIRQWVKGYDAGVLKNESNVRNARDIWNMQPAVRQEKVDQWRNDLVAEQVEGLVASASKYNQINADLAQQWSAKDTEILKSKRIIGCTTTAAAKYSKSIQAASPDVLLVEEAGEILESHVLTALTPATRQLILIGDHKQLRPKVNDYQLTVEKGEGFDLNRSLFERMILKGYPHQTLTEQHRMRPEISALIRSLTYPELSDAQSTKNRPDLRGLQSNIIFISHAHPEDDFAHAADKRDGDSKSSKQNSFEVDMVLKIIRYLAQQGYMTNEMVILTPYLGQLHRLQDALRKGKDNDPLLNDLDSFDLVKAGLLDAAAAKLARKSIRLATIDNYQGEESDIVIVSLTRSNAQNDIGFMSSPERVNVLLSRARNALIMIGNANTFSNSRKGGNLWKNVFSLLKKGSHVFDGFPVQCLRHPDRKSLLKSSDDFEANCPEGGCTEPCGVMLRCGLHKCPSKCHQIYDHSKMKCNHVMRSTCSNGHKQTWECHRDQPLVCTKCERQAKQDEQKRQEEHKLQQQREAEERQYQQKMDVLNAMIAEQEQAAKDLRLAHERGSALDQREEDLKAAKDVVSRMRNEPTHKANTVRSFAGSTLEDASATSFRTNQQTEHTGSNQNPTDETSNPGIDQNINSPQPASSSNSFESASKVPNPISGKPIPLVLPTPSEIEWERQKTLFGANNTAIDAIMALTGLESVKESVLTLKATIDTAIRQGVPSNHLRLNVAFLGNPGTGKTTIAREYAKFLASIQALPADCFKETTGSKLANDGVKGAQQLLEEIANAGGGTLFIDEAYQLTAGHNYNGKNVLDFLLAEMENNTGKIAFIVAGYNKEMESFFEHNPGLQSRVPNKFLFEDYSDSELLSMFQNLIKKRYGGRMMIEGGHDGLYVRIAIRRLGRGRGRPGFGNARDLENMLNKVTNFQAKRLTKERAKRLKPNDFLISGEDLIGLRPSDVLKTSSAWAELHKMIGIRSVKDSILSLTNIVEQNYDRELQEKEPLQLALNRIFLGSPGTGKTTVASLYGQILAELRLISNGEVVVKNPSDFIGAVLGESEKNTKGILATTIGKVLVIDEAYMLYGGGGEGSHANDPYKTAVIDTIVAEAHNKPGEDRCILMLGYKDKMTDMFQNVNQGLSRRFAVDDPMNFEDFDNSQLLDILNRKLQSQDITATDAAKDIAIQLLDRSRNRPNFGNAGEVENLLSAAKQRYQGRIRLQQLRSSDIVLEPQDFDPDFDRGARSLDNLRKLFEDTVGFDYLVEKLENYQNIVNVAKQRGLKFQDYIPFNFIFKGPPGTGKTTVARKMGRVYYDIGILATTEVVECSATDLVGQHVGQTGPKTMKLLEKALGKVLFIDEAYRLSEGHFAQEAIDELVGLLTQEKFKAKLIVILAGYDQDMNRLLAVNAGLASRFPEQIFFKNMTPDHCIELLQKQLVENKVHLPDIDTPNSKIHGKIASAFKQLSKLPSWGNARDVLTLAKKMVAAAFLSTLANNTGPIELPSTKALGCVNDMLTEQLERCSNTPSNGSRHHHSHDLPVQMDTMSAPPPSAINMNSSIAEEQHEDEEDLVEASDSDNNGRDPGVSDEIWRQLQEAKLAEEQRQRQEEEKAAKLHKEATDKKEVARRQEREVQRIEAAMKRSQDEQKRLEMLKKLEAERLKAADARRRAAEAEQKRKLEEQRREEERKKEAKKQEALRSMGVCVAGFRWHKVSGGYRCAGGSHYVSDSQLPS